ncbi:MAG: hypothetical protein DIU56_007730 [Pseudomonadota bacterium]
MSGATDAGAWVPAPGAGFTTWDADSELMDSDAVWDAASMVLSPS